MFFGIAKHNSNGGPYISKINTSNGMLSGIYRKRNCADNETLFSPETESYFGEVANVGFGVAVCAGHSVPTEFVAISNAGAAIVFHPSVPGLYGDRKTDDASLQSGFDWWRTSCIDIDTKRAKELGIYIAVCTQAGSTVDEGFLGWSVLFGSDGEIIAELPNWRQGNLIIEI